MSERQTINDERRTMSDERVMLDDRRSINDSSPSSFILRPPSAIELHIDELVLHGFAASDRRTISAAVERELTRLIGEQGLPPAIRRGGERGRLDGGTFNLAAGAPAETIGAQIAQAVYAGLIR
jgi:hypothetical protein